MADHRILLIDNEESVLKVIEAMLERPEYEILSYRNAQEALQTAKNIGVDLVITDLKMTPMDGLEVLRSVKQNMPGVEVILVTAFGSMETAIEAMKEGVFDYLIKPVKMEELRIIVARALAHQKMCRENRYLKEQLEKRYHMHNIVGKSPQMLKVFNLIEKVSASDLTVLVTGESGTGKELVARAIHYGSRRKDFPFVAVNCGAIPETLLESELFGHTRGAFTGAIANRKGLFAEADKGTIFLDEISGTSPALQVSLLRILEEKEFRRVGEAKTSKTDVRVIAASNVALEDMIREKKFREDLYYRLSVVHIDVPPLRERGEDIPLLVQHFLNKHASGHAHRELQDGVMNLLMRYDWPGNVRELENVLEGAAMMGDNADDKIRIEHLPEKIRNIGEAVSGNHTETSDLHEHLRVQERAFIETALADANHDKKSAAKKLGISLPSLYRKIEELGISISKPTRKQT